MIIMKIYYYIILLFNLPFHSTINFSEDISQIIYNNCTSCHRENEIAAFLPLTNYNEVYDDRYWIAYAISGNENKKHGNPAMPPWSPNRNYSTLIGERFLSEDEIHLFLEWVDSGADQGDEELEYPMPYFPSGSAIGTPDLIIEMEQSYFIEGNYKDNYRCFVLKLNNQEDKDVSAIEFIPGNREAVHHAIVVSVPSGSVDNIDQADNDYGYECFGGFGTNNISDLIGGYAPGMITLPFPKGLAQKIPAFSDLILQVHYAPLNQSSEDQSLLNIFYKKEKVERYIQEEILTNWELALPPNQITTITETFFIPTDISLLQFFPHSHLLGKSWEIYATTLNQEIIPIIKIDQWDFDWQSFYSPEYMLHIPAGSTITAICEYDNTISNPDNPNNPPEWVFAGEGTGDEMFFVPLRYVLYEPGDESIYLGSTNFIIGDVNVDGSINVLDIVILVNAILNNEENQYLNTSDVNSDGIINILDVVSLINLILS